MIQTTENERGDKWLDSALPGHKGGGVGVGGFGGGVGGRGKEAETGSGDQVKGIAEPVVSSALQDLNPLG